MGEPRWIAEALLYVGQKEVPGPGSSAWIKALWHSLAGGAWFWNSIGKGDDSKLPWCGAFVARVVKTCGIAHAAQYASAKAWSSWGTSIAPTRGAVVVFARDGGGHVGFLLGAHASGAWMVLGGNQGDAVRVSLFDPNSTSKRVLAVRWPPNEPLPLRVHMPVVAAAGAAMSGSEA